jgi:hypothetical protein
METTIILNTNGRGLWSNKSKPVIVTGVDCIVGKIEDGDSERLMGELMVRFDMASWDTDKDGLIYTDDLFLSQLREFLLTQGFTVETVNDVFYSEQGMQGDEYVSLDVGSEFCQEWLNKYPETEVYEY